jgi:DNA-directed RNA polymerase subunit beta
MVDTRNVHPSYFGNIDPLDTSESDNIGVTQQLTIDAYITSARGMFSQKEFSNKEGSGMLSTTTAMIPFIENNDGARIIMASNQAKQMLPLKNPEPPIVQSGYESILTNVLSDSFIKRSPCNGKVSAITRDYIEILCKENKKQKVDITPQHLHSGSGVNTLSVFRPIIQKGQAVKENQIIAEGGSVSGGTISLGRTLASCYMPYKGYNYEDGLVISETLVSAGKMTSLHGITEEVVLEKEDRLISIAQIGQKTKKGEPLFIKALGDIEELLGDLEEDETEDIYDGKYIKKSPGGTVVDIEVYSNLSESAFPKLKDLIDRTNKKHKKPDKEKFRIRGEPIKGVLIKFKIEQELKTGLGDKLCNRYGNKGIISLVEKEENMPRTPWGERVEIIFNPLGVLNRTNIGQMYEMYCGLISKELANRIVKTKSKSEIVKLLKAVMSNLDNSKDQKFSKTLINNISKLSDNQFKAMVNQISSSGYVPIIIPPFKAPSHKNIKEALKVLGLKSGYKLKLPEFNTTTRNEVPFGYVYMSKLEHIGANKIHSRSTGPTVGKTMQPTAGKRREGGQRMGEHDTWALLSYNCPLALSEFFGPLSDDVVTKKELEADIVQTGVADYRETKASPTKDLLNAYFVSLMLSK